jgi:hypothetical protein
LQLWGFQCSLRSVRSDRWVTNCHTEPWLKSSHFAVREVVDCLSTVGCAVAKRVGKRVHAFEGPVPSSEVQHGSTVVGKVFCRDAASAGGLAGEVGAEGSVQGITADELMEMEGSGGDAGVDDAV